MDYLTTCIKDIILKDTRGKQGPLNSTSAGYMYIQYQGYYINWLSINKLKAKISSSDLSFVLSERTSPADAVFNALLASGGCPL